MVELGAKSIISQKAYLCTASHDFTDPNFPLTGGSITIGEEAWVAASSFVGPGVTIGDKAVVGACAVVTKDVATSVVVAGNPAQIVKER